MVLSRALIITILYYFSTLIVGILAALLFNAPEITENTTPTGILLLGQVSSIFLMIVATIAYFRHPSTIPGARNGLKFSIFVVIVTFFLNLIVSRLLFGSDNTINLSDFYLNPSFWINLLLLGCVGVFLGNKFATDTFWPLDFRHYHPASTKKKNYSEVLLEENILFSNEAQKKGNKKS